MLTSSAATKFYADVFDWEFKPAMADYPDDKVCMFDFRPTLEFSGGITKAPDETEVLRPGYGGGPCMCWLIKDVNVIVEVIEKAGGKILSKPTSEGNFGMYRYFQDTEGNIDCTYEYTGRRS
jgi:predicted enzyme related to lactoylglutathione lyase